MSEARLTMRRKPYHLRAPVQGDPVVRTIFAEMAAQRVAIRDVAERSGIHHETISNWRGRRTPKLIDARAVLNVLGLDLTIRRMG